MRHYAARLRGCQDRTVMGFLERRLWTGPVAQLAYQQRWKVRQGQPRRLANLAVWEMVDPGVFQKEYERYTFAGFGKSEWHRVWKGRYDTVYRMLGTWADQGQDNIGKRLRLGQ